MHRDDPTWILLVRDVHSVIRVPDEPSVFACLILDADTGLVRGVSIASGARDACVDAARSALSVPAGPLPPAPPGCVVYDDAWGSEVLGVLRELVPGRPRLVPGEPPAEAEDIFDSFIAHMTGRTQSADLPDPSDWGCLYRWAADFCRVRPWQLWSDADHLDLVVRIDGQSTRYVAVVMGQEGIQRGLSLYPGAVLPDGMDAWRPGEPVPLPEGSLMIWLDPVAEVPAEFMAKASRYDWPDDLDLAPIPALVTGGALGDPDRRAVQHLAVALAAVVGHRRPRAVSVDARGDDPLRTEAVMPLGDGLVGEYTIT